MPTRARPSILIIDNDEGVVKAIATRLSHMGYICINAQSGARGLAAFAAGPIDLVITDLNMPVLDGAGMIDNIRRESDVPIIVVTGYRKDYCERINPFDNVTILEKPFPSEALVELVELELSLSTLNNAAQMRLRLKSIHESVDSPIGVHVCPAHSY